LSDRDFFNPEVVTFEALMGVPCLVLLRELGMGKSRAMQREKSRYGISRDIPTTRDDATLFTRRRKRRAFPTS